MEFFIFIELRAYQIKKCVSILRLEHIIDKKTNHRMFDWFINYNYQDTNL